MAISKVVESFEAIVKFTPQSTMRIDGDVHTVHTNETLIRPLVRCRDCKWSDVDSDGIFCEQYGRVPKDDWFCADGERRAEMKC